MVRYDDYTSERGTDPGTDTVTYSRDADEPPSLSVVWVVAAATGTAPKEMRPLYDAVDPDALDRLFGPATDGRTAATSVTFPFQGCTVTVHGDGRTVASLPSE